MKCSNPHCRKKARYCVAIDHELLFCFTCAEAIRVFQASCEKSLEKLKKEMEVKDDTTTTASP